MAGPPGESHSGHRILPPALGWGCADLGARSTENSAGNRNFFRELNYDIVRQLGPKRLGFLPMKS